MANLLVVCEVIERSLRRERIFRDRTNQLDTLNDEELIARYRMPRDAIISIIDRLRPTLERDTLRSHAISPETQVLVTLRYLSKGGFLLENGDLHGIAESSVSRIFHTAITAICEAFDNIIFPSETNTFRHVKHGFYKIAGFPMVIGAIDGTLVAIKRPPSEEEAAYVCRKGYHAINVQAICDSNLRFTNIVSKWPGSSHDSMILTNSRIGQKFEMHNPNGILLGDSGYACRPWLMTPIGNPNSRSEERYNSAHCKTRNTVERAFGVLKSRFRCLHKSTGCLQFSPKKCAAIIMAACKLHNYCIDMRLPNPPLLEEGQVEDNVHFQGALNDGHQMRRQLIHQHFNA